MKIAVEGCCHGELDKIYETLEYLEKQNNTKVDILLICGDFQAVRNLSDLKTMAVPSKYQKMNTFWKYYSGEKKAPVLTVFIGGNHEASNYLQELPYGGWVAPNIYYMGYANVLQFGGCRIGGLSGIWKGKDHHRGHFEHPPYSGDTMRSAYHVRSIDTFRLKQIKKPIDIFLSHDWPRGVYNYGNVNELLWKKKYFRQEVEEGSLGSPVAEELMHLIKPDYWFSAHLHVKFAALIDHELDDGTSKVTKFLALDKCLPKRKFLQVLDIPHDTSKPLQLELDPEWLCVLKSTNHLLNLHRFNKYMPGIGSSERYDFSVTEEDLKNLDEDFQGLYKIPSNFTKTSDCHDGDFHKKVSKAPEPEMNINPQTELLCDMLGLTNPFAVFLGKQSQNTSPNPTDNSISEDPHADDASDDDDSQLSPPSFIDTTLEVTLETSQDVSICNITTNPEEISLDDIEDEDCNEVEQQVETETSNDAETLSTMTGRVCDDVTDKGEEMSSECPAAETSQSDMDIPSACTGIDRKEDSQDDKVESHSTDLDSSSTNILLVTNLCNSSTDKPQSAVEFNSNDPITNEHLSKLSMVGSSTPTCSFTPRRSPVRKRSSDESDESMFSSPNKSKDSDLDYSRDELGKAKAKKFKRRNQSIYTSTEEDSLT